MGKFKVGDIIIGNEKANDKYLFTREAWEGKVTRIKEDRFEAIR